MNTNSTNEINLGYFALSFGLSTHKLNDNLMNKKACWIINGTNYNAMISENIDSMLESSNLKEVFQFVCNNEQYSNEYVLLYNKTKAFQNGLISSLISGIKSKAIKSARMYLPFVRLSLINHTFIYTHFVLIEYIDNKAEFLVFEEIPGYDEFVKNIDCATKYATEAISSIRKSVFSHKYYSYLDQDNIPNVLYHDYVLKAFISCNFHIDLDIKNADVYVCSNGVLQCSINKSKKKQLSNSNRIFRVGVTTDKKYEKYMSQTVELTIDYVVYNYLQRNILEYLKSKNKPTTEEKRLQHNTIVQAIIASSKKNHIVLEPIIKKHIVELVKKGLWDFYTVFSKPAWDAFINRG